MCAISDNDGRAPFKTLCEGGMTATMHETPTFVAPPGAAPTVAARGNHNAGADLLRRSLMCPSMGAKMDACTQRKEAPVSTGSSAITIRKLQFAHAQVGSGTGDVMLGMAAEFRYSVGLDINAEFLRYR
jgi:hypothetical protein